jgi:hypothetical protein
MRDAPAEIYKLAASVPQYGPLPPHLIAWGEREHEWVIVFEDGRKLTFAKLESQLQRTVIDPSDGISDAEARSAGQALNTRKQKGRKR